MAKTGVEVERHDGLTAITIKHEDLISLEVDDERTRILLDDEVASVVATRIRIAEDAVEADADHVELEEDAEDEDIGEKPPDMRPRFTGDFE